MHPCPSVPSPEGRKRLCRLPLRDGQGSPVPFRLQGGSPNQPTGSLIVCVWCVCGGGSDPETRRRCKRGMPLRSSRKDLRGASSQGGREGTAFPAPWRPGPGPRSAPGPSARFFVARPSRSIAPSPSPAAGKGHPRTGGGGEAPGTLGGLHTPTSARPALVPGARPLPALPPVCSPRLPLRCLSGQTAVFRLLSVFRLSFPLSLRRSVSASGSPPCPH